MRSGNLREAVIDMEHDVLRTTGDYTADLTRVPGDLECMQTKPADELRPRITRREL